MLLPHTPAEGANIKAERIVKIVESADFSKAIKGTFKLKVSVGVATFPDRVENADDLFDLSDEHMFRAREQGGNQFCSKKEETQTEADIELEV